MTVVSDETTGRSAGLVVRRFESSRCRQRRFFALCLGSSCMNYEDLRFDSLTAVQNMPGGHQSGLAIRILNRNSFDWEHFYRLNLTFQKSSAGSLWAGQKDKGRLGQVRQQRGWSKDITWEFQSISCSHICPLPYIYIHICICIFFFK